MRAAGARHRFCAPSPVPDWSRATRSKRDESSAAPRMACPLGPRQIAFDEADPERCADRDQGVIEVVARVVQHARPHAVARHAVLAFAVADEKVASWAL